MNYYYKKFRRKLKDFIHLRNLKKYYNNSNPPLAASNQRIIYMCDGHRHHGGLGDRLSGLISTYAYCKEVGKEFKAYWVSPYNLSDFLIPNEYDWRIEKDEISYNSNSSTPVFISYNESLSEQQAFAKKLLDGRKEQQVHVYTNMKYPYPQNFPYLFKELFKPSPLLQNAIDKHRVNLPKEYISITFRFQQLLGDLEEGNFPTLKTMEERQALINRCTQYVKEIHKQNPQYKKILVTSDSTTFLNSLKNLPYVYIIEGEVVHVDFNTKDVDKTVHLKSFIDLFLIADASKIYCVIQKPLYKSGFPLFASLVNGHMFINVDKQFLLPR
ncbi:MAG: hypothetical protein HDS26_05120 [Bacteroides sp.]|nr:hypothetical protein [Bacteroides sp.]MBD5307446.1 hypothetical protein [Bacteroides sp.]